jgi:hypothetical protein
MVVLREGKRRSHRYNVACGACEEPNRGLAGGLPGDAIMISSVRNRAVDEVMDAYVNWRQECIRVSEAYQRWRTAVRADAALAFHAYLAALDREERAAEVYGRLITALEAWVGAAPTRATGDRAPDSGASRR